MLPYQPWDKPIEVALLAEGVDRNNLMQGLMDGLPTSPSSRRAWIEIYPRWLVGRGDRVALLAEGVDRNVCDDIFPPGGVLVALLAEGVDRNPTSSPRRVPLPSVALLAEGVDRNLINQFSQLLSHVTLLAEGTDRNQFPPRIGHRHNFSKKEFSMHTVSLTHQLVAIQDDFDLDKIIESGQCFRPQKLSDGRYRFLSGSALLYLTPLGDGQYDAAWYGSDREYWADYFDLGRNYAALRCSLAGQSSYLDKSLDFGQGIRILHQDPWEMLITFLISQRKSIPAIRTAVEHLARCCGEPLSAEGDEVFLFPTPQQLCGLSEAQLMGCGLGYRTRYIQNAAAQASSGTLDLGALAVLPDDALFSRLLELDGVGKKVANCVCLFGYGRTAMAPIDVWIQRLIDEEFGGRDPFPSYDQQAGIVQQYLFYYKRSTSRSVAHKK